MSLKLLSASQICRPGKKQAGTEQIAMRQETNPVLGEIKYRLAQGLEGIPAYVVSIFMSYWSKQYEMKLLVHFPSPPLISGEDQHRIYLAAILAH